MTNAQKFIAFKTILTKEMRRFLRIWVQTILPPMITTALYFIIFGNLIGSQIDDMKGYTYIDFIVPGLILMSVITNSYANVVSSFFSSKFQRNVEEMLVSPLPNYVILLGYTSGGVARGLIVGFAVTLVSTIFSDLHMHDLLMYMSMMILTAIMFSLAGFINAVYAKTFDDISIIPTFVLTPLTYLGGVFYTISMLPEFWQNVSLFNPILHMINAFRFGMLGVSDLNTLYSYLIVIGFCIGLFSYCMYLLNKGYGIRT